MKIDYKKLVFSLVSVLLVGFFASYFTSSSVVTWYPTLNKPFFNPPNWVFGPVWTFLYILMGVSLYLVLASKSNLKDEALYWFSGQLFLNFTWSIFFFGWRSPLLAFIDIVLLWGAIWMTIFKFNKISKNASYLLIPYIIWVSFAAVLNFAIILLN